MPFNFSSQQCISLILVIKPNTYAASASITTQSNIATSPQTYD